MNTYNQEQTSRALNILEDIYQDQEAYKNLPIDSKERLAQIVLRAFQIQPKE
jgi:hypothetical protein